MVSNVYAILGNQRRLNTIKYLSLYEPGTEVEVRHVARVIRGIEMDVTPRHLDSLEYESAYNGLIQSHLPKLENEGLVEYNQQAKEVTVTPRLKQYAAVTNLTDVLLRPEGGDE